MTLFWRVALINAAVLAVAVVALVFSPATVSAHVRVTELAVLVAGALALLAVNVLLLRRVFAPLRELTSLMRRVDPLNPGRRIAVQRSVASFRSRSRFTTWLHSVGVHTALAHERARMRRREVAVDTEPDGGDDSGRISSIVVRRADLEQATRSLTPEQRAALRLWEDGHAYDDIAARLDVPVGTVRSRISRARRHLREATALHDDAPAGDGDGPAER